MCHKSFICALCGVKPPKYEGSIVRKIRLGWLRYICLKQPPSPGHAEMKRLPFASWETKTINSKNSVVTTSSLIMLFLGQTVILFLAQEKGLNVVNLQCINNSAVFHALAFDWCAVSHSGGSISCLLLSITAAQHQICSGRKRLRPNVLDSIRTFDGKNMCFDLMGTSLWRWRFPDVPQVWKRETLWWKSSGHDLHWFSWRVLRNRPSRSHLSVQSGDIQVWWIKLWKTWPLNSQIYHNAAKSHIFFLLWERLPTRSTHLYKKTRLSSLTAC